MKKKSSKILLLTLSMAAIFLASCSDSVAPVYESTNIQVIESANLEELNDHFARFRYTLKDLEDGVPPFILHTFPKELADLRSAKEKKRVFFKAILPMVLLANEEIRREREALLLLQDDFDSGQPLSDGGKHMLETLAGRYKVKVDSLASPQVFSELTKRIDTVPPELALAQAANESAWGTSRFSQLANNIFGEWTFIKGTGIVPEGRPEGETYEVRRFDSLFESIRSYLKNLNTHYAYAKFRQIRQDARLNGRLPKGEELAEGLEAYSSRRDAYIRDLQSLIRQNKLERYAEVSLRAT